MDTSLGLPLLVLALIDSTSFGTLLIPLWFMLAPQRPRHGRILLYLGTVGLFYLLLGWGLLHGGEQLRSSFAGIAGSEPARWVAIVAGAVLLLLGLTIEPWTQAGKERKRAREAERRATRGPGRVERLRHAAIDPAAPVFAVIALALVAAAVEAASMLPYLAAIGMLLASGPGVWASSAILVAYCLVMIAPALVLLGLRIALHDQVQGLLEKTERWMSRNSREALAWVLALVGIWLLANNL